MIKLQVCKSHSVSTYLEDCWFGVKDSAGWYNMDRLSCEYEMEEEGCAGYYTQQVSIGDVVGRREK